MQPKIKLIFITGVGRNGSTLLGRVMGEHDNCVNVGEALSYMLNSRLKARHEIKDTGTGVTIAESPFWRAVFEDAGFDVINSSGKIDALINEAGKTKLKALIAANDAEIVEIKNKIKTFLKSISKISGAQFIIDTSKQPNIPLFLLNDDEVDVAVIHLVRDAASVVASRGSNKQYLKKVNFLRMIGRWIVKNKNATGLKKYFKYILVNYEAFCTNPYNFMKVIADFIGLHPFLLDELKEKKITFHPQNIIAGNPDKYTIGSVPIKMAVKKISKWKQVVVTIITAPWASQFKSSNHAEQ